MKIVTYNVNGLRQRISQFGSLAKLLNSFDADIVCFQETKLRRQELSADLFIAEGYESFFSCTRTSDRGRTCYSGVATFCRVKAAFSSNEVALPVAAEEGFSGLVDSSSCGKQEILRIVDDRACQYLSESVDGLEEFEKDDLMRVDGEGRCVVTDHDHFVLFNLYGPRADSDDVDRIQFKRLFYKILQKRWENLLNQGRRVFVVGDLNIAPTAMDRCDAGPDFENNEFRRWFRSLLVESGGLFVDIFRAKHPDRREAFTCWPSNTGAEQFNYGTRIDHILCAGPCIHREIDFQDHDLVTCHVKECDILTEYKRWKPGSTPRWKGGLGIKLEGSDHAPVYMSLVEVPDIHIHGTPSLSSRYLPMIYGVQQTLVSILLKREAATQIQLSKESSLLFDRGATISACSESTNRSVGDHFKDSIDEAHPNTEVTFQSSRHCDGDFTLDQRTKKKTRKSHAQLSLTSFFQKKSNIKCGSENSSSDALLRQKDLATSNHHLTETHVMDDQSSSLEDDESTPSTATQVQDEGCPEEGKNSVALLEWQRIQQLMQNSIPLCEGHKEPCVARVVKKPGSTFGRRFYVCGRAEGPASNPEDNCGYFKWASSKSRNK